MNRLNLIIAAVILWAACGRLLTITVEEQSSLVVAKGTIVESLVGELGFSEFTALDITDSQELRNQGVEPGDITEVYLETFTLTAAAPSGADLSFLDELSFYVSADGLDTVLIASQTDFPAGEASVELVLEDVDLTEYVVSESMDLTTEVSGGRPPEDTTIDADFSLAIRATAQGACNQLREG